MNINTIDQRLTRLEASTCVDTAGRDAAIDRILSKMARTAERLIERDANEENMSIVELCAINIDWSNPWDPFRVLRYMTALRRGYPGLDGDERKEFIDKLNTWLANRGPSTPDNTLLPSSPWNDEDRETANNFSRLVSLANDHYLEKRREV